MAEISKLSKVAIADVAKVDAVLKADIANFNGLTIPSAGVSPPLDTYTGAAAGYSVRLLRTAYTGDIMRVRRDSDNVEADVGFDSNNELSLTSPISNTSDAQSYTDFADFVDHTGTPANGFVRTWYDQASSNDAEQSTAGDQPKVYDASSGLLTENGKPYINFQSSQMTTGVLPSGTDSTFGVYKRVSSGSIMFVAHDNGWFYGVGFSGQTGTAFVGGSAFVDGASFTGTRDDFWTTAGSQILVSTIRSFSSADDYNMTYQNGNNWNNFMRQELIIYPDDQSSNRTDIETNINDYFSIYT